MCLGGTAQLYAQREDTLAANRIFSYAFEHKLFQKPIGDIVEAIGRQFLEAPYEGHTLDATPDETIVTNLHSFDCVTYVENVLALARTVKNNRLSFSAYRDELIRIRYRGGRAAGYPSRLHYFSEWIRDNEKKGVADSRRPPAEATSRKINFMTGHGRVIHSSPRSEFHRHATIEKNLSADHLHILEPARSARRNRESGMGHYCGDHFRPVPMSHTGIAVRNDKGRYAFITP
jgi:hypothetical protein